MENPLPESCGGVGPRTSTIQSRASLRNGEYRELMSGTYLGLRFESVHGVSVEKRHPTFGPGSSSPIWVMIASDWFASTFVIRRLGSAWKPDRLEIPLGPSASRMPASFHLPCAKDRRRERHRGVRFLRSLGCKIPLCHLPERGICALPRGLREALAQ